MPFAKIFSVLFIVLLTKCSAMSQSLNQDSDRYGYECIGTNCPTLSLPVNYEDTTIQCNGTESFFKDPKDCHYFYYCPPAEAQDDGDNADDDSSTVINKNNITAVHFECPQGYGYHEQWRNCVPENLVKNCSLVFCPAYIYDGVIPDPKDCTAYYRCTYGFPSRYKCRKETVFNPESGVCEKYNQQELPDCLKKPNNTTSTTTVSTTSTSTTSTVTTPTSSTPYVPPTTPTSSSTESTVTSPTTLTTLVTGSNPTQATITMPTTTLSK